ncbi:hypothetical protein J2Z21_001725 [Streptomyces griseochromogenes]|nr:hypothetical protein [Streptomyces griseochromogenes]
MPGPVGELDVRHGGEGTSAHPWSDAGAQSEGAELFWISTVRPDGRPHVTPTPAVWRDGALRFGTGPVGREARWKKSGSPDRRVGGG